MRKFVAAAVVVLAVFSIALADEFTGRITKVDGDKVTVQKMKGKGKNIEKDGDPITLPVAKGVKITKGKFDKDAKKLVAGDEVENGLKNELFSAISDKGVNARITTDADNKTITAITVIGGKKKKGAE